MESTRDDGAKMKALQIKLDGFRPIEEAISCAGGVKQDALTESLELKQTSGVFAVAKCWIGMLLQGIFADSMFCYGRAAGEGVHSFLEK